MSAMLYLVLFSAIINVFALADSVNATRSPEIKHKCEDIIGRKRCMNVEKRYKKFSLCEVNSLMKKYCPRFCGFCKAAAPVPCASTVLGCCWDNSTTKRDSAGSNCPACRDKLRLCKRFEQDCFSDKRAGSIIRKACPFTCRRCQSNCYDLARTERRCEYWANIGMCHTRKSLMNVLCKKTCHFC